MVAELSETLSNTYHMPVALQISFASTQNNCKPDVISTIKMKKL